jgi:hypothetical protein
MATAVTVRLRFSDLLRSLGAEHARGPPTTDTVPSTAARSARLRDAAAMMIANAMATAPISTPSAVF